MYLAWITTTLHEADKTIGLLYWRVETLERGLEAVSNRLEDVQRDVAYERDRRRFEQEWRAPTSGDDVKRRNNVR